MPLVPNTTTPNQPYLSDGDGTNGGHWGDGPITSSLGQHAVLLAVGSLHTSGEILRDVRNFAATSEDAGTLTSYYTVPPVAGPSPYPVCTLSIIFPPLWTNVDATTARTLTLKIVTTDSTQTNTIQVTMTVSFAASGPGQSYTFSASDYIGATVVTHGSDLGWYTGDGAVTSVSGTIPYSSVLTWDLV